MANQPTWTIAVPTYNGQAFLAETLKSVIAQSDQGFEFIISDDVSTDHTLSIVSTICGNRATIYRNESGVNLGLAGNWNRCVELAQGSWVSILHQDDLLEPDFFETHHRIAHRFPDLGMITGPAPLIDARGMAVQERHDFTWPASEFSQYMPGEFAKVLVSSNPVRCPATSFRKSLHREVGGFSAQWRYVVDWYFWYRVSQAASVGISNRKLAAQRWHALSETRRLSAGTIDLEENDRIMNLILDENFLASDQYSSMRQAIRLRMARAWLNRAYTAAKQGNKSVELTALKRALQEDYETVVKTCLFSPRTVLRLMRNLGGF